MNIKTKPMGDYQTNCYIINVEGKDFIIDPGIGATEWVLQNTTNPVAILNTHGHFDHVGGNKRLKDATGAEIIIHPLDAKMLGMTAEHASAWGLPGENSFPPDKTVEDGDSIVFGNITLKVIHTPGHSPGGISLLVDDSVFVGDTLFEGSIGRTDFPEADHETLISNIRNKLFALDDAVKVYPGHMGTTTIGQEKRFNPFCAVR